MVVLTVLLCVGSLCGCCFVQKSATASNEYSTQAISIFWCRKGKKFVPVFNLPEFDVLQSRLKGGSLWQSDGFWVCLVVVLFVLQNFLSVRSLFP